MTPLTALLLPILVATLAVFVASAVAHMVLPHHRNDYARLTNEDEVLEALRRGGVQRGEYGAPFAGTPAEMSDPAYTERATRGPVALVTVLPSGPPSMTRPLIFWFLLVLTTTVTSAYVAGRALPPAADYLEAFRFAGTTAFAAYVLGIVQQSIWFGRPWGTTLRGGADGLAYALITAGIFGWLWPG